MFNKQHDSAPGHSLPWGSGAGWVPVLPHKQQEPGLPGKATAASGLAKGLPPWQGAPSSQDMKGRNRSSVTQVQGAAMCFPAALGDTELGLPGLATWPSFSAGGGPQVLGQLGRVTCCQSRAAWHSQRLCCSYSPCSPSGLLPVLAQLTPTLGTQETWVASGRNIPVPVMPTSSGTPRSCVDPGQQADCAVLLPLSLAGRCYQLPHPSWGHVATQAWQQRPCVHHP